MEVDVTVAFVIELLSTLHAVFLYRTIMQFVFFGTFLAMYNNNNNVSPLPVYHFVTGLIVNTDVLLPVEIHHGAWRVVYGGIIADRNCRNPYTAERASFAACASESGTINDVS